VEYWNIGTLENWVLGKHHPITPSLQYSTIPVFISPGAARFESPTRGSCLGLRIASQNPVGVERLDRAVLSLQVDPDAEEACELRLRRATG